MGTVPEGQIPYGAGPRGPGDVEPAGVRPVHGGIAAGGGVTGRHRGAPRDDGAVRRQVPYGVAEREVTHGRVPAQRLVHHVVPARSARPDEVELVPVRHERSYGAGDQVQRGLVPGDGHQDERAAQFLRVEPVAVVVTGSDQGTGEIVAGGRGPGRGDLAQDGDEFAVGGDRLRG